MTHKQINKIVIWAAIALILICFFYPFAIQFLLFNANFIKVFPLTSWPTSGTFGDTYGAINAFFAAVTVLGLLYTILLQRIELSIQRKELKLQRKEMSMQRQEMQDTRKEFTINRATGIVYNQLEKIDHETHIFHFITPYYNEYSKPKSGEGLNAFMLLQETLKGFSDRRKNIKEKHEKMVIKDVETLQKALSTNRVDCINSIIDFQNEIIRYIAIVNNSVSVLKEIFVKGGFNSAEVNELKNIFFLNIGQIQLKTILKIHSEFSEYQSSSIGHPNLYSSIDAESLSNIMDPIKSILYFRKLEIDDTNFEELKVDWKVDLQHLIT